MLVCLMMLVLNHTPHTKKQTIELVVASHTTNTMPRTNYRFVGPHSGPTPHEHVIQGPHAAMGMVLPILAHFSTPIIRNHLLIRIILPYGQPNFTA
jgi:hypothetical protein